MGKKNKPKSTVDSSGKEPAVLRTRTNTVKPSVPEVVDLTKSLKTIIELDADDEESIISIEIEDDPDDQFIDLVAQTDRQVLLLQYKQQLGMHDKEISGTTMKQIKKNVFTLQTKAFEKYNTQAQKQTLKSLVSMVDHFDEKQAHALLNDDWLNDETIDQYLGILAKQHDHIAIVLSGYANDPRDFFEKLKREDKKVKELRDKYINAQRLLWPICLGNHWYLVIIEKMPNNKFTIHCIDSFNSNNTECFDKAKMLLTSLYPQIAIEDLVHKEDFIRIPTQHNALDCGVSVCYYAKLSTNKMLPKRKVGTCDYSQFRFDIAETLGKNKEVEEDDPQIITKKRHPKFQMRNYR